MFLSAQYHKRDSKSPTVDILRLNSLKLPKLHFLPLTSSPVFFSSHWASGCPSKVSLDWLFSQVPSLKTVFDHNSKHLHQKYSGTRLIFDSLHCVWKCGQILPFTTSEIFRNMGTSLNNLFYPI